MAREPGYKHSDETRRKISEARKAHCADPAVRERMSAVMRGRETTPQHRENMRQSALARWAAKRAAKENN